MKQTVLTVLLAFAGVIIWGCSADISGSGGEISDCTKDLSYMQITDIAGLQDIANDLTANYCLANDIDGSPLTLPIGYPTMDITGPTNVPHSTAVHYPDANKFTGNFDGNRNTISNLTINESEKNHIGLFGYTEGPGIIKNLTIHNPQITGKQYVGALVGYNNGKNIENVHITADDETVRVKGETVTGGLIGGAHSSFEYPSSIKYSSAEVGVTGKGKGTVGRMPLVGRMAIIGGLVGLTTRLTTIENCYATGTVSGDEDRVSIVGGLVGSNGFIVKSSYATGSVNGDNSVGGLVGNNHYAVTIEGSYATGSVDGNKNVGGLVGGNNSGSTIKSSYATGSVNGDNSVGGLVGNNNTTIIGGPSNYRGAAIKNSYATGNINNGFVGDTVGGLVGNNLVKSTITNSYFDTGTTKQRIGVGKEENDSNKKVKGYGAISYSDGNGLINNGDNKNELSDRIVYNNAIPPGPLKKDDFGGHNTKDNWDFSNVWKWKKNGKWPVLRHKPMLRRK